MSTYFDPAPPFDIWALVAWGVDGHAAVLDGDGETVRQCSDWGPIEHWARNDRPERPGLWRFEGRQRFIAPDDFEITGSWSSVLLFDSKVPSCTDRPLPSCSRPDGLPLRAWDDEHTWSNSGASCEVDS